MHLKPSENNPGKFVNRKREKKLLYDFCTGRLGKEKRCLIFTSKRDIGTTCFLEHIRAKLPSKWFPVYADCKSSDPETIFSKFFAELDQHPFLRLFAYSPIKEAGRLCFQLYGAILSSIPFWGRPAAVVVGGAIPALAFTPYSSISSQRFGELITSGRWKRPVVFLVDNAQEIKPQSLNILKTVFSARYDHVKFVLCFVDSNDDEFSNVCEFETRLNSLGLDTEVADFPPPDVTFVSELVGTTGVSLSALDLEILLKQSDHRISYLIAALSRLTGTREEEFSILETEVLRYLLVAQQPLAEIDIKAIVLRSPRLAFSQSDVEKAMVALLTRGWLKRWKRQYGSELEIAAGKGRKLYEAIQMVGADIVAAQELYRFFCDSSKNSGVRHAPTIYGGLLYKLAKQVDPQSLPQRALDLVRISLGQGDLDAARYYLETAINNGLEQTVSDLYARLAFHVSVQEYEETASIFEQLGSGYWSNIRFLRVIHAVVTNRLRRHEQANGEIDQLLTAPETTSEEWALLSSYKVAGLIHDGHAEEALEIFESTRWRYKTASNEGYALRNCAAVYFWEPTKDVQRADALLAEACEIFQRQNDSFGYLTTRNNRGALLQCSEPTQQAAATALPIFQEVFDGLSIFGVQHLEEVGANMGICLLLTRQIELAANHLRKLVSIVPFDFPKVLMESALAFAESHLGHLSQARERMATVVRDVHQVCLGEATYRAAVNAAAIEALAGDFGTSFQKYLEVASSSGFWGGRNSLARIEDAGRKRVAIDDVIPFFSFDFFQYWSQNPLSVLSPSTLPEKTERNDVLH
jgi:tetratricopeptide (TPR) repeat protein